MSAKTQPRANPFPGLRPFRGDEHHLFFGREDQTAALLQLLRQKRFLAVVGTSGSGKSSLVQAGMIAELYGGTMTQAGSTWEVILLRPGGSPIENLARALVAADLYDVEDPETLPRLLATLRRSRFGLVEAIKQSDVIEPGANLLVVVDQFEELFRFRQQGVGSEEVAAAFVNLLLTASEQAECPIYVTLTMRSDYLGDCSEIPGLAEAVNEGEYLIPRLLRDQKRDAIEKPIGVGGAKISPLLVQRLLNDVGDDPDQLPVLQHALMRMWDVWSAGSDHNRPIELGDFEATGGLASALSNHADEIYAALPDDLHRDVCERVFKTLTEKGTDNRGIRRPTRLSQLEAIAGADRVTMIAVLDAYRRSGVTFVMPGIEQDLRDQTVLDLSHESLMRGWQRLRSWVEDEAQSARIFRRLSDTASLWQSGQAGLFRDPDLQIALSWREQQQPGREWAEQYEGQFQTAMDFLDASNADAEAEQQAKEAARQHELEQAQQLAEARQLQLEQQQRSARKLRKLIAGLAVVAMLAGFACVAALIANNNAHRLARKAELAQRTTADALTQVAAEKNRAVDAERLAKQRLREVESAQEESDRLRRLSEQQLHLHRAALAQRELQSNQIGNLKRLLKDWPTERRGWEWHRINYLADRSVATLRHPQGGVQCIAYDPKGRYVASGSLDGFAAKRGDGIIRVWDIDKQKEVFHLSGQPGSVKALAYSADGELIASGGSDKKICVWSAVTGKKKYEVEHSEQVESIAFSPQGDRIAADGVSGTILLWDVDQPRGERRTLGVPMPGRVNSHSLAFSPDGQRLWSAHQGSGLLVWDLDSGKHDKALQSNVEGHGSMALSRDGKHLAYATMEGKIVIHNLDTHEERFPFDHGSHVWSLAFSPDGQILASAGHDRVIHLWSMFTGRKLATLRGHEQIVNCVAFSPDGRQIASGSNDGTLKLWDLESAEEVPPLRFADTVNAAAFCPDGKSVVSADFSGAIRFWDTALTEELQTLYHRNVRFVTVSRDGKWLASLASDGTVWLWDTKTGVRLHKFQTRFSGQSVFVAFDPESRWLALADSNHAITRWEMATQTWLPKFQGRHDDRVHSLAVSPDGKQIASIAADKTLRLWDVASGEELWRKSAESEQTARVIFSPDGNWVLSGEHNGVINVRSVLNGEAHRTLQGHSGRINSMAFSPDGKRLVSGGLDTVVRLWDVELGAQVLALEGHLLSVRAVGFSPDGRTIVSGSFDGTLRLWEVGSPPGGTRPWKMSADARAVVDDLFQKHVFAVDVLAALKADYGLDANVREAALRIAEGRGDHPYRLSDEAWAIVQKPDGSTAAAALALRKAEAAHRVDPDDGPILTTLGAAQYRTGRYQEAVTTLTKADRINEDVIPANLAFLAMAQHRLDQQDAPQAALARLRELLKQPQLATDLQAWALLAEAERLLQPATTEKPEK